MSKLNLLVNGLHALSCLHVTRAKLAKSKKVKESSTAEAVDALALREDLIARGLSAVYEKAEVESLPTDNGIAMYFHCKECLKTRPEDQSPADYARLSVGFTKEGLQVWCWRHGINVAHIHFEGQQHPANLAAGKPDARNRTERT